MSSKTKSVTAVLIVLALVAGVGMTKAGSKYKTQDKVNLIFANVTSNSAKKAGEKRTCRRIFRRRYHSRSVPGQSAW